MHIHVKIVLGNRNHIASFHQVVVI